MFFHHKVTRASVHQTPDEQESSQSPELFPPLFIQFNVAHSMNFRTLHVFVVYQWSQHTRALSRAFHADTVECRAVCSNMSTWISCFYSCNHFHRFHLLWISLSVPLCSCYVEHFLCAAPCFCALIPCIFRATSSSSSFASYSHSPITYTFFHTSHFRSFFCFAFEFYDVFIFARQRRQ